MVDDGVIDRCDKDDTADLIFILCCHLGGQSTGERITHQKNIVI